MSWDCSRFVSFDLETHLIAPGLLAPPIICGSTARIDRGGELLDRHALVTGMEEGEDEIRDEVLDVARGLLLSDHIIIGANIAFDFGCLVAADPNLLPLIFRAHEEHRVFDVQIAQALHAVACGNLYLDPETGQPMKGRYSLEKCVRFVLGREDAKVNDEWRLRYAELEDVPISEWPEAARQYPIDDAVNTLEVAVAQVKGAHRNLGDLSNQVETAWAMHLGAIWGLRTDSERVAELRARVEKDHADFVKRFRDLGFFRDDGKEDGRAVKRAIVGAYGGQGPCPSRCVSGKTLSEKTGKPVNCKACSGTGLDVGATPTTPTGGVSADRDTLMESGDEDLIAFGENEAEKIRETYLPKLESEELGRWLRPNVLVASGRTSYDGLIQLLPRSGGVRECFRARDGYLLCSVDYAALELCTLAQVCYWLFGESHMMETINASGDPGALHTAFAARLVGITPEAMTALIKKKDPVAKNYRQASKAGNFGFPGGMGAAKFVLSKRKKSEGDTTAPDGTKYPGIRFCVLLSGAERCGMDKVTSWKDRPIPPVCKACVTVVENVLRPAWFDQWPEVRRYLGWVAARVSEGRGEFPCFGTDRIRGGLDFTNGANNGFQALAADGAKHALRKLVRECYLDRGSVLYGTRPIFFVHDEIIAEVPEKTAHLAGPRMAEVMVGAMREYVPDVCIVAEPALMKYWYKSAETVYDEFGRLIPWEPKENK